MSYNKKIIFTFLLFSFSYGQLIWHEGNLKKIEQVSLDIIVIGDQDPTWEEKLTQIALLFLEGYKLKIDSEVFSPSLVIEISLIRSNDLSLYSHHIKLSVFDLFLTKEKYLENIPKGKKSIAINVTLQALDKTLTEKDLDQISKDIIKIVSEKTGAIIRS